MRAVAKRISPQHEVLTVHGTADKVIPDDQARRWSSCIATHRLISGACFSFPNAGQGGQQEMRSASGCVSTRHMFA